VYVPSFSPDALGDGVGEGAALPDVEADGLGVGLAWATSADGVRGFACAGVLKLKSKKTPITVATMATAARVGMLFL
jgi:hypothetical protein